MIGRQVLECIHTHPHTFLAPAYRTSSGPIAKCLDNQKLGAAGGNTWNLYEWILTFTGGII
jgi:hypothetical protein